MHGTAIGLPAVGTGPNKAALRRDDQVSGVGIKRFGDQRLADCRAVGIGGVDEIDAAVNHPAQQREGARAAWRVAPDAGAGDAHRAKAEAPYRKIAADRDRGIVGLRIHQCAISTGTVMCRKMSRVMPPTIVSRRREWP
jgi:hypothetical protein